MNVSRRRFAALGVAAMGSAALSQLIPETSDSLAQSQGSGASSGAIDTTAPWALELIRAAQTQVGVTVRYDGAYRRLAFPGGDIDRSLGVCTDVIIRAYRDAFGFDLQQAVNRDIKRAFSAYPKTWGLARPDANIDHRRVLNLERFFMRKGAGLPLPDDPSGYRPGDLVTQRVGARLPHIAIVSDRKTTDGRRPLVVHNIGTGTRIEDTLAIYPAVYRFRFDPKA